MYNVARVSPLTTIFHLYVHSHYICFVPVPSRPMSTYGFDSHELEQEAYTLQYPDLASRIFLTAPFSKSKPYAGTSLQAK